MQIDPINSDYKQFSAKWEYPTLYYTSQASDYQILFAGQKVLTISSTTGILQIPTSFNNPAAYFSMLCRIQAFLAVPDVSTDQYSMPIKSIGFGYVPNGSNKFIINGAPYQKGALGEKDILSLGKSVTTVDVSVLDYQFTFDASQLQTTILPAAFDPNGAWQIVLLFSPTIYAKWQ